MFWLIKKTQTFKRQTSQFIAVNQARLLGLQKCLLSESWMNVHGFDLHFILFTSAMLKYVFSTSISQNCLHSLHLCFSQYCISLKKYSLRFYQNQASKQFRLEWKEYLCYQCNVFVTVNIPLPCIPSTSQQHKPPVFFLPHLN